MSSSSAHSSLRLVLADDHLVLRQALRALLEQRGLQVVADEADGRAAVAAVQRLAPDVAVLDVAMPVLNGVEAAREIARVAPSCPVILLSGVDDTRFVREALKVGVRGFVQKSQGCDELVHAIEEVREGRLYVSPGASQAIVDACATPEQDGSRLTPRERQVLQLVGEGKSTKQIAEVLHISVKTAEFHRGRLMKKLNVHDTANLVRYAIREGWIAL
ncbi:MAG TPA: response regulator transcription factor [Gemmatimonadales bacterium]|jgi:DNA-binding NarL/FixJ family response regulator|nr:response regulator transcription factor [Gemmatimonadales bacterium]